MNNGHESTGNSGHGHDRDDRNRSGLGMIIQNDDIFRHPFTSNANHHAHNGLLNLNTNINSNTDLNLNSANSNNANIVTSNNSVQSNGSSSINTTQSNINTTTNTHNSNSNSNSNNNDNISVSTGNSSIYSVQPNHGSNKNANVNGMYYSNGSNGHGHVSGHANGIYNSNKDDKNSSNSDAAPTNIPVKYKICMGNQSNAFAITLLVPIPAKTKNGNGTSPFQKVVSSDDAPTLHDNGEVAQAFALRIPLSYLVQQQQQETNNAGSPAHLSSPSSSPSPHTEAPWLDRTALRRRISESGRAIGLDPTFVFQSVAAVEETASKLPKWLCPLKSTIEAVSVEVILSEGIVTLVASAAVATTTNTGISNVPNITSNSSPSPLSPPSSTTNADNTGQGMGQTVASPSKGLGLGSGGTLSVSPSPRSNYNVLNEKSAELLATAPSFPPPGICTSRPNPNHHSGSGSVNRHGDNTNGNIITNGNIQLNGSNNRNVHSGSANNAGFPVLRTSTESAMSEELYFNNVDHCNNVNSNNNSNHMNSSNHGSNNASVFNSHLRGSSLGSWTSYSGQQQQQQRPSAGLSSSFQGPSSTQQQQQRPSAGLSSSFQGPSPIISMRNSFGMASSIAASPKNSNNIIGRGVHNGNGISNNMHLSSSFPSYNYGDTIMREPQHNKNEYRSILFDNNCNNNNGSIINIDHSNTNINRPNPSIIIGPLLNMGFSKQECEAAAVAIHRHQCHENNNGSSLKNMLGNNHNQHQSNNYHDGDNNYRRGLVDDASVNNINRNLNTNQQECENVVVNTMNNMSLMMNSNHGNTTNQHNGNGNNNSSTNHHNQSIHHGNIEESPMNGSSSSVWGNAGKMKMVKTPTNNVEGSVDIDDTTIDLVDKVGINRMSNVQIGESGSIPHSLMQQKQQEEEEEKMIRVLDIPPDLNAFVFHCNSQTRDECLERGLFGYVFSLFTATFIRRITFSSYKTLTNIFLF